MEVDRFDQDRLLVAREFASRLRAAGLETFAAFMALQGGRVARDFPGRRTVRLEFASSGGDTLAVYLKRYEANYLSPARRWLRRLGLPGCGDEAAQEWAALLAVCALGIPVATPVALGQDRPGTATTRSFLMTREIPGAIEGGVWLAQLPPQARREFLQRIASMMRRLHAAGLVHKDFYIGHVLVSAVGGEVELFLIDLQRVTRPAWFPLRWQVKDLGAMAYSSLNAGASPGQLMRAYLDYRGVKKLGPEDKSIARAALARVAWLRTRRPKHDG